MKLRSVPILAFFAWSLVSVGPVVAGSVGLEYLDQSKTLKTPPKLAAPSSKAINQAPASEPDNILFLDQQSLDFNLGPDEELDLAPASGEDEEVPSKAILPKSD